MSTQRARMPDQDAPRMEWALYYASCGIPVVPLHWPMPDGCSCKEKAECSSIGKHPIVEGGLHKATKDEAQIRAWWTQWPIANIGGLMGQASGLLAIDLDVKPHQGINGIESLRDLELAVQDLPDGPTQITGGGGRHRIFKAPPFQIVSQASAFMGYPGIDLRGDDSIIALHPTLHETGCTYEWEVDASLADIDPPELPKWLINMLPKKIEGERVTEPTGLPVSKRTKEVLNGEVPQGEQRLRAVAAARNLWSAGRSQEEATDLIWHGLQKMDQNSSRPWRRRDAETIVNSIYRSSAPPLPRPMPDHPDTPMQAAPTELPTITANGRQLRDITEDALAVLRDGGNEPAFYVSSGAPVRILNPNTVNASLDRLKPPSMRLILSERANWFNIRSEHRVSVAPPKDVVENVLALPAWPGFPELDFIARAPVLLPGGVFAAKRGYYPEGKVFICGTIIPTPWPEGPQHAVEWLKTELYSDFPFNSDADKAHAFALLFLPFVRPLIPDPTPLHLIDAPRRSSGKTLVAKVSIYPFTGSIPGSSPLSSKEEEIRKHIFAILRDGNSAVFFDNVVGQVASASLEAALTSPTYTDRVLQVSETQTVLNRATWILTSNNATVSSDLARRGIWIRLDPSMENPEDRDDFRHPNILLWVQQNRARILSAIASIVTSWAAAGMPLWEGKPLGSFERWTAVMGGLLDFAGIPGFLANRDAMNAAVNLEDATWRAFFERAYREHADTTVTVADLWPLVENDEGIQSMLRGNDDRARKISFGGRLRTVSGRVYGGIRLYSLPKEHSANTFKFANIGESRETRETFSTSKPTRAHVGAHAHTRNGTAEISPESPQSPQEPVIVGAEGIEF